MNNKFFNLIFYFYFTIGKLIKKIDRNSRLDINYAKLKCTN